MTAENFYGMDAEDIKEAVRTNPDCFYDAFLALCQYVAKLEKHAEILERRLDTIETTL